MDMGSWIEELNASRAFMDLVAHLPAKWLRRPLHFQLRWMRLQAGLTQAQLARRAGVHQSFVAKVEGGRDARLSSVKKLYAALGYQIFLMPVRLSTQSPRVASELPREGISSTANGLPGNVDN